MTPVKTQGQCTSDWAFSATGALEGQHFNATGKLVPLSEQNLVDCSGKQGNIGCVGGEATQAFQYIKDNNGIDTEDAYPYEDDVRRCRFTAEGVGATVTGFSTIKSKDEGALQEAVATIGPISVAIDADHNSFQMYKSGGTSTCRPSTVSVILLNAFVYSLPRSVLLADPFEPRCLGCRLRNGFR